MKKRSTGRLKVANDPDVYIKEKMAGGSFV